MQDSIKMLDALRNKYYEKLEDECVDFVEYEDLGEGRTIGTIKKEFTNATINEMVDFIYQDSWQGRWANMNMKGL